MTESEAKKEVETYSYLIGKVAQHKGSGSKYNIINVHASRIGDAYATYITISPRKSDIIPRAIVEEINFFLGTYQLTE